MWFFLGGGGGIHNFSAALTELWSPFAKLLEEEEFQANCSLMKIDMKYNSINI